MGLQYRDIETREVLYADQAKRTYDLFRQGDFKGTMQSLFKETTTLDMSLRERQELKILELKEACTASIHRGFSSSSTGHTFGFNDRDQDNFSQQLGLIGAGYKGNIRWKTVDAGPQEFTLEQFMGILMEAAFHKNTEQEKYWNLEKEVLESTKTSQVTKVVWV